MEHVSRPSGTTKSKYGRQYDAPQTRQANVAMTIKKEDKPAESEPTFEIWKPALPVITTRKQNLLRQVNSSPLKLAISRGHNKKGDSELFKNQIEVMWGLAWVLGLVQENNYEKS